MNEIKTLYTRRYHSVLLQVAERLERHLRELLRDVHRVDRISARAKSIDRFVAKATQTVDGAAKYEDPLSQIQDQIGARIITFYVSDVDRVVDFVSPHFRKIEERELVPDRESEFGYIGKHFIFFIPSDLFDDSFPREDRPKLFELQVKTLFQHSWAEANHDLAYKPRCELTRDHRRKIAYTAAQAWGADQMFEELFKEVGGEVP